jgi:hypothetical protein
MEVSFKCMETKCAGGVGLKRPNLNQRCCSTPLCPLYSRNTFAVVLGPHHCCCHMAVGMQEDTICLFLPSPLKGNDRGKVFFFFFFFYSKTNISTLETQNGFLSFFGSHFYLLVVNKGHGTILNQ